MSNWTTYQLVVELFTITADDKLYLLVNWEYFLSSLNPTDSGAYLIDNIWPTIFMDYLQVFDHNSQHDREGVGLAQM